VQEGNVIGPLAGADGKVTPERFDQLKTPPKMALLNLYAVLTDIHDSNALDRPWFSYVRKILRITQERFVAVVDRAMFESVSKIQNDPWAYKGYAYCPFAEEETLIFHVNNVPSDYAVNRDTTLSVKYGYEKGNIQFTMMEADHPQEGPCAILDCDMDEHLNPFLHLEDLFKHTVTGGTNPIEIHDYIVLHDRGVDLGYTLQPKGAAVNAAAGR